MLKKQKKRIRRHKRVRAKIFGTHKVPRLCIFRSNKHIYAQLIDDAAGKTLISANDQGLNAKQQHKAQNLKEKTEKPLKGKILIAYQVGELIAKKAIEKKIKKIVFDRGGYRYHGRVKALAEGARNAGLQF